jgi:hypothetical protein
MGHCAQRLDALFAGKAGEQLVEQRRIVPPLFSCTPLVPAIVRLSE